ncbi:metallophosphoesterase [bacterium]|nr:metallophosphoesterase [bacterium]
MRERSRFRGESSSIVQTSFLATILPILLTYARGAPGRIARKKAAWLIAFAAGWGCLSHGDAAVPSFSVGPYLQSVTETSIIICWESDVPSDGSVEYWVEGTQNSSIVNVGSDQRHEFFLDNLQPGTAYRYRVRIPAEGEGSFFTGGFRTAPTEDVPFTFVVYGDTRGSGPEHQAVAEAMGALNPAFVIHTGDLVSSGDSDYYWGIFWESVAPSVGGESLAGNCPFYPAIGNHEYMARQGGYKDEAILPYQSYFVLPLNGLEGEHPEWAERFYSFRYGPAFFIVLDTNRDSDPEYDVGCGPTEGPPDIHPGSPQHEWLVSQLEVAKAQCHFTFVCFHPAPYSSGPWGKNNSLRLRFLDALFRQYGVDAVVGSHDHFYERCETYVDNYRLLYFVEGAGGAPIYSRSFGWDQPGSWMWDELNETYYTKAFDNSSHSFLSVDIAPLGNGRWRATFSATRPNGEVFDMVEIRRPWGEVCLGEAFIFSFEGTAGQTYQVEYTDDFPGSGMEWQPLGAPILADGAFIRVTDDGTETGVPPTDGAVRRRFYRAQELP